MATTEDYIEFVVDQLTDVNGEIRYRKMFGEYMIYANDKPILLVCDNTVFVKMIPCMESVMRDAETGTPYAGAKLHYILDIENRSLATEVANILELNTPLPKPRKSKTAKKTKK